jgi:hypothetical protein
MFPDAARAFSGKPAAGLDPVVAAGFSERKCDKHEKLARVLTTRRRAPPPAA